jgi:hypothetical protein
MQIGDGIYEALMVYVNHQVVMLQKVHSKDCVRYVEHPPESAS